jgi:hypothetical protein
MPVSRSHLPGPPWLVLLEIALWLALLEIALKTCWNDSHPFDENGLLTFRRSRAALFAADNLHHITHEPITSAAGSQDWEDLFLCGCKIRAPTSKRRDPLTARSQASPQHLPSPAALCDDHRSRSCALLALCAAAAPRTPLASSSPTTPTTPNTSAPGTTFLGPAAQTTRTHTAPPLGSMGRPYYRGTLLRNGPCG